MEGLFKKLVFTLSALVLIFLSTNPAFAEDKNVCAVYVTGIGCPHCAKTDPIILQDIINENPNLVVIEYEIYQTPDNSRVILDFNEEYGSGFGVPLVLFDSNFVVGDSPILKTIGEEIEKGNSHCPLPNGQENINTLDISNIPNSPKIWKNNRILIAEEKNGDSQILLELLFTDNIQETLDKISYEEIEPEKVPYSGGSVEFEKAAKIDGWIFQWNESETTDKVIKVDDAEPVPTPETDNPGNPDSETKLTFTKLLSLSVVDAINPCALAVLTLMLIAILTYNPGKKRKILYAGLAFSLAVFSMYLFYGLVIVKFFQLVQMITSARLIIYKILGIAAIILGLLNIWDVISYKPGRVGTEMPMFMRPKIKKIISGVTSPKGAFIVGLFVTVFLLPCTIGPYVIAGGILSAYEFIKTIPPLLLYNLIFILPMLIITAVVYFGIRKIENVSEWKDKNVRYLHLIAGIIMTALGIAMIAGWV